MIELSIAIVVIGILVGGVVLGGKIMDRARLAKISSELSQIKQAFLIFNDIYASVPGDYSGMVESAVTCESGSENDYSKENLVCVGNGNGKIEGADTNATECTRAY